MRIFRALGDFLSDLSQGDPVALAIGGVVLFVALLVASIWIIDLRKRKKENERKKPSEKPKPKVKR